MSYSCSEFIDPSLGAALPTLRPLEHGADALWVERLTALVAVTCFLQSGADFTVAQARARSACARDYRNHPMLNGIYEYDFVANAAKN